MTSSNTIPEGLFADDAGVCRCTWCQATPFYQQYHDTEWGFPVADDRRLFEKICLEGFQSGLSWLTILNKREGFRAGFANFEIDAMARFGDKDVGRRVAGGGLRWLRTSGGTSPTRPAARQWPHAMPCAPSPRHQNQSPSPKT